MKEKNALRKNINYLELMITEIITRSFWNILTTWVFIYIEKSCKKCTNIFRQVDVVKPNALGVLYKTYTEKLHAKNMIIEK